MNLRDLLSFSLLFLGLQTCTLYWLLHGFLQSNLGLHACRLVCRQLSHLLHFPPRHLMELKTSSITEVLGGESEPLPELPFFVLWAREVPNRRASYTGSTLLPHAAKEEKHPSQRAQLTQETRFLPKSLGDLPRGLVCSLCPNRQGLTSNAFAP